MGPPSATDRVDVHGRDGHLYSVARVRTPRGRVFQVWLGAELVGEFAFGEDDETSSSGYYFNKIRGDVLAGIVEDFIRSGSSK